MISFGDSYGLFRARTADYSPEKQEMAIEEPALYQVLGLFLQVSFSLASGRGAAW